jgi:hypothetical protein
MSRGGLAALEVRPGRPDLEAFATMAPSFLSRDLKTSPVASSPGRASCVVRVTTWLPSGLECSCPGASPYCLKHCYAIALERCRPSLGRLVDRRLEVWQSLEYLDLMTLCAAILKCAYRMQCEPNRGAIHYGGPPVRPIIRIGGGGDLDRRDAGNAWAGALYWAAEPASGLSDLRSWLYSRSYGLEGRFVDPLEPIALGIRDGDLPNTVAYLSTDPSMYDRTAAALASPVYSHLPVAVVADDLEACRALLDRLGRTSTSRMVCPTDRPGPKAWPLASQRPGEPWAQGACSRCGGCIRPAGHRSTVPDVMFPVRH